MSEQYPESVASLEELVAQSKFAEQIFEKLAENIEGGNPLLGIKVLLSLPENYQRMFYSLIHNPLDMVESLLMNQELDLVRGLFEQHPKLKDNALDLVFAYATRALKFPDAPPTSIDCRPE